jgi:hypothetical protein
MVIELQESSEYMEMKIRTELSSHHRKALEKFFKNDEAKLYLEENATSECSVLEIKKMFAYSLIDDKSQISYGNNPKTKYLMARLRSFTKYEPQKKVKQNASEIKANLWKQIDSHKVFGSYFRTQLDEIGRFRFVKLAHECVGDNYELFGRWMDFKGCTAWEWWRIGNDIMYKLEKNVRRLKAGKWWGIHGNYEEHVQWIEERNAAGGRSKLIILPPLSK